MELIEIKETGRFFRITEKEQIFFIPQEEKEKTTLEYALPKYTGYELYYEGGGSRPVQFVSKTGKVRTLILHFEEEEVYLFETEEQLCKFIEAHPYSKFAGYMPFAPETIQKEKEEKILETEEEIERLEYLLKYKKEKLQELKGE